MTVPKTAVHENDFPARGENQIRPSRQFGAMQTITITQAVRQAADPHLRAGVSTPYSAHPLAARGRRQGIGSNPNFAFNRGIEQITGDRPFLNLLWLQNVDFTATAVLSHRKRHKFQLKMLPILAVWRRTRH